jgi:hypothetical protein
MRELCRLTRVLEERIRINEVEAEDQFRGHEH